MLAVAGKEKKTTEVTVRSNTENETGRNQCLTFLHGQHGLCVGLLLRPQ